MTETGTTFLSSVQEPNPLPHAPADALWVRVYYEDTDFSGRVYHASYLRFLERGRTEWLRRRGFAHRDLAESSGVVFAVRSLQIEYLAPAMMDDLLEVETSVAARAWRLDRLSRNASCAATRNLSPPRCWSPQFATAVRRGFPPICVVAFSRILKINRRSVARERRGRRDREWRRGCRGERRRPESAAAAASPSKSHRGCRGLGRQT